MACCKLASEDCAFGTFSFEHVRDVQPGEMVISTPEGQLISKQVRLGQQRRL
jgi:glutamine phosphoribosylpyrophosphate amidotransferase